jgi:Flp pilus assembly protein TadB
MLKALAIICCVAGCALALVGAWHHAHAGNVGTAATLGTLAVVMLYVGIRTALEPRR